MTPALSPASGDAPVVIGVDIGSSGSRAVAADPDGREVAVARARRRSASATTQAEPGQALQGLAPAAIREEMLTAVRSVLSLLRPSRVHAISITCFRQTLILHDEGVVTAAFGNNAAVDSHWVTEAGPLAASMAEPRLRWLADSRPDTLDHERLDLSTLAGWLAGSLTGVYVEEPTSASTTGLLDATTGLWTGEAGRLARKLGLSLPPAVSCGHVVGTLRADVARGLGLSTSAAVVLAGGDAQAAAGLARLVDTDATVLACGTHWQQLTPGPIAGNNSEPVRITSSHRTGENYRETLIYYPGETFTAVSASEPFSTRELEMAEPALGVHVFFRSTLDRAVPIDRARPVVTWSREINTGWRAGIPLAVMVGASLTLERVVRRVHDDNDSRRPLIVVGGAAQSAEWLGFIAAALGRPVVALRGVEAASLGAAYLAWQSLHGVLTDAAVAAVRARASGVTADAAVCQLVTATRGEWTSARELLQQWDT